ncbi:MAG TPA: DoxX family protein [Candidatus Dormibacteraeota bacterium]|jgi:putative oxidoreductase|nr:DoxX family protein [Candidatus Dormibacteraeota bacterium]
MLGVGLLILRVVVGLTLAAHGAQKLFGWFSGPGLKGFAGTLGQLGLRPAPAWAVVAGLAEFLGGLALALGLLTPLAAYAIAGSMLVAIFTVHLAKGFWNHQGGLEFPLTILAAVVAVALAGPGAYSLDRGLGFALPEPLTLVVGAVVLVAGVLAALASRASARAMSTRPQTT